MTAKLRHRRLAGMPERRMPHVMSQRYRLHEVLVQPQPSRNRPRNLRNLEAVGHPRTVMIARHDINLRLVLHTAKRLGMKKPVPVPLVRRTKRAQVNLAPTLRLAAFRSVRRQNLIFQFFRPLPYRLHTLRPFPSQNDSIFYSILHPNENSCRTCKFCAAGINRPYIHVMLLSSFPIRSVC